MKLKKMKYDFSICQVRDFSQVNLENDYCFIGKTDEERSLVCVTNQVPQNITGREDGWKAFRIEGVLDFALIGVLSKISALLADHEIGIFVVSTYNTDYILTKENDEQKTMEVLSEAGYSFCE